MLQVKKLTIVHKKDFREIVKDFSLVLNPGDKAAIIGEEGNGKSTLLKWIYDPDSIETYANAEGERICIGEKLGYLAQELEEKDKEKTVYEFFCAYEGFFERNAKELAQVAKELGVLPDFFYKEQKMGTLSGGEKVKAQMAGLLIEQPTVLLLDEPSNDIDIETLEWLEQFILQFKMPILYVSHDETLIEHTANMVVHLEQLKRKMEPHVTVAKVPYQQYLSEREARLVKQEQQAFCERREEKKRLEKLRKLEQKVEHGQNAVSRQDPHGGALLKKKMKAVKSLERRYEREAVNRTQRPETEDAIFFQLGKNSIPAGKTVLEFSLDRLVPLQNKSNGEKQEAKEERETREEGEESVLARNIFLRIRGGEKVCIIGKNGAGKTTLLRQMAKELLARKDIKACYMPQDYEELLDRKKTPVEYLSVTGDKEEISRIRTYLGSLKYTAEEMSHPMAELSGGQKAKVLLLQMSLSGADVLILDEPTRNFSPLSGPVIRRMLREYKGAILSISHDRKYIREVCGSVYRLLPEGLVKESEEEPSV